MGVSATRNIALDYAKGEYLICVDPDDWIELNTLEVLYNVFKEHDVASIIFDANRFNEFRNDYDFRTMFHCHYGTLAVTPYNMHNCPHFYWGKAYKLSEIKKYGIKFDENLVLSEDLSFFYEYYTYNPNCLIIENILYHYRIRANSIVRNAEGKQLLLKDNQIKIMRYLNEFYSKNSFYEKYKIALFKQICLLLKENWMYLTERSSALQYTLDILNELDFYNTFQEYNYKLNPLVSVILPIRRDFSNITKILKSIQTQSYKNIELICLSNNENMVNILKEYTQKDRRIKVIECDDFNYEDKGLKTAKGDYIIFTNELTSFERNFIKTTVDTFQEMNASTLLMKSGIFSASDNVGSGYLSMNETLKSKIEEGKLLPIFKKILLEKYDNNTSTLTEKYSDLFLIDEFCAAKCEVYK